MTVPTFVPPRDPSPGSSDKPEVKVLRADFGDGYTQATRQLNNVRRVQTLKWPYLTTDQTLEILDFLEALGGADPFYYRVPGDPSALLWTCDDWSNDLEANELRSVTAVFRQSFNVVA